MRRYGRQGCRVECGHRFARRSLWRYDTFNRFVSAPGYSASTGQGGASFLAHARLFVCVFGAMRLLGTILIPCLQKLGLMREAAVL